MMTHTFELNKEAFQKAISQDELLFEGTFRRTEPWNLPIVPAIPAVLAIFEEKGVELAVMMPARDALQLAKDQPCAFFYRKPVTKGSKATEDLALAIEYSQPRIIGDFYRMKHSNSSPSNQPVGWGGRPIPYIPG